MKIHSNFEGKDFIFIEKKTNYPFWISLMVIVVLLCIVGRMEMNEIKLKREITQRAKVSTHVWMMTDTASDQLKNSDMIQIKLK